MDITHADRDRNRLIDGSFNDAKDLNIGGELEKAEVVFITTPLSMRAQSEHADKAEELSLAERKTAHCGVVSVALCKLARWRLVLERREMGVIKSYGINSIAHLGHVPLVVLCEIGFGAAKERLDGLLPDNYGVV